MLPLLPGHAPWGAQADAALATVALARGDVAAAAVAGGAAFEASRPGIHEDASLEIMRPGRPGGARRRAIRGPRLRPGLPR